MPPVRCQATFAHLPIYALEDLCFVPRGEAGAVIAEHNTARRQIAVEYEWRRPFVHAFQYALHVRAAGKRERRGTAPAQIPGAKISVCHGVGGLFTASGTIIMSNEPP